MLNVRFGEPHVDVGIVIIPYRDIQCLSLPKPRASISRRIYKDD